MEIETLLPLDRLELGAWAEVHEITGRATCVQRLAEIGIRPGCRLRMLQAGRPCLVQVEGARLSLRNDCPTEITVRLLGAAAAFA